MSAKNILLLGNPKLYENSSDVDQSEIAGIRSLVDDLHDTMMDFRRKHGFGRAIAAPQIGIMKRVVYMLIDKPCIFINPILTFDDNEIMEVWDNCMSFPNLLVKVRRHKKCRLDYSNLDWKSVSLALDGDVSELLQHECDHLDGILATMRAIDGKSFAMR